MKLIKLDANKESFRTIEFNEKGLSIILAKKKDTDKKGGKGTYNGTGKSLTIALIHFCLGSNEIPDIKKKLNDWEFYLTVEINNEIYLIKRQANNQKKIYINDKEYSLTKFREYMGQKVFDITSNIPYLTFRNLISRFIRPTKESYNSYDFYVKNEDKNPHSPIINTGYLLGLNISLINSKFQLKGELDKIKTNLNNLENDEILKKHFQQDNSLNFSIYDIKERINKLEKEKKDFKIAENYNEIEKTTKQIGIQIHIINNKISLLENALKNIAKSKELKVDINLKKIKKVYEEANVHFGEIITKKLDEINLFHNKIIENRKYRLNIEEEKLTKELMNLNKQMITLQQDYNEKSLFLKKYGAFEKLEVINNNLYSLKKQYDKLVEYKELKEEYEDKINEIKLEFKNQDIEANKSLKNKKSILERNLQLFRSFSREFYEDKAGGIEIIPNENINTLRYEIKASLDDDSSGGVNSVKIFSFDFTLLKARNNHNINFLFHDSKLFSEIDPRQRAILFRLAYENTINDNLQYIASLNQDQYDTIMQEYNEEEQKRIFGENNENIVLYLSDEKEEGKLLGVQVNLKYDKD